MCSLSPEPPLAAPIFANRVSLNLSTSSLVHLPRVADAHGSVSGGSRTAFRHAHTTPHLLSAPRSAYLQKVVGIILDPLPVDSLIGCSSSIVVCTSECAFKTCSSDSAFVRRPGAGAAWRGGNGRTTGTAFPRTSRTTPTSGYQRHARGGRGGDAWLANARTHELKLPVQGPAATVAAMPIRGRGGVTGQRIRFRGQHGTHPRHAARTRAERGSRREVSRPRGGGAKTRQRTVVRRAARAPAAAARAPCYPSRRCTRRLRAGAPRAHTHHGVLAAAPCRALVPSEHAACAPPAELPNIPWYNEKFQFVDNSP